MIPHVIHPGEDPLAPFPLALDPRIVLRLVPEPVLLAAEAAFRGLGTGLVSAEVALAVPVPVFSQIACPFFGVLVSARVCGVSGDGGFGTYRGG